MKPMTSPYPTANLELAIKVAPLAIIGIIRVILLVLIKTGMLPAVSTKFLLQVSVYLGGLIVLDRPRKNCSGISRYFRMVSHDGLRIMLLILPWTGIMLMRAFALLAINLGAPGWLIVDDVLIAKQYAKKIQAAYWDWDHSLERNVFGHRVVAILWTNGWITLPVAYAFWHKKGAVEKYLTKNELARKLLKELHSWGLKPRYVTFDNWYAGKGNLRFIVEELRWAYVTRLKTNTVIIFEGRRYQVSSIGKHIGNLHYYRPLGCYIGSVEVVYPKVGPVLLTVVKKDPHPEPGRIKYLLTSDLSLTNAEVVRRYRSRWVIEFFFRACPGPDPGALKQLCGVGDCPSRLQVCVERHFALSCLAFVCLELIRNGRPEVSLEQLCEQLKRYTTVTVGDTPLVVTPDGICTPAAEDPPLTDLGLPEVSETSIKQLLGKVA